MTHEDLKTVAYYANSSYATHKKKEMSVKQFFMVRDYTKKNAHAIRFMDRLARQNKS